MSPATLTWTATREYSITTRWNSAAALQAKNRRGQDRLWDIDANMLDIIGGGASEPTARSNVCRRRDEMTGALTT